MIDLTFRDIPDLINGVRWKLCNPECQLSLENLGTQIQLTSPFPDSHATFFYEAQLIW